MIRNRRPRRQLMRAVGGARAGIRPPRVAVQRVPGDRRGPGVVLIEPLRCAPCAAAPTFGQRLATPLPVDRQGIFVGRAHLVEVARRFRGGVIALLDRFWRTQREGASAGGESLECGSDASSAIQNLYENHVSLSLACATKRGPEPTNLRGPEATGLGTSEVLNPRGSEAPGRRGDELTNLGTSDSPR